MVNKKTVYEVNGKTFDTLEDAEKEEIKTSENKNREIAVKFIKILIGLKSISDASSNSKLFKVWMDIEDEDLKPRWFVRNDYFVALIRFLDTNGVRYIYNGGDERVSASLKIQTGVNVVRNIPDEDEVIQFIEVALKEIKTQREDYLNSVRFKD